ncbi:type IV conjugative transfer system pilin TraA [Escherichia coli 3-073-06_S3_C1]|nr:type IV conjugative transfer system pilin TraA [Escherichia coli 2-011-08_S3_C2]KDW66510.1 type IV conjugative transfer system pilin TraA [Escherichia coli 2-005-03_S4_C1]KDY82244.1 type IV conjugative transfer system pilin TraA [Escherichia coli 2-474-04_S3_C1]KDY83988.1 type IV conjugative transfer system pilin TraA [Escherichia coli 2-474-04_S3_C2]KDZ07314.1 type IV conjugative transfer system pilin TraA [Escherichia coli 2-474-04_S3_C3]KDZ56521.1 type IV conjugative transfer system pili
MAKGNDTVKATFGKDSSIVKWVVLAEVLVGAVMYMMTKNVLVGFAILSVFIAVGMSVGKRKANAVCNTCSLQTKLELLLN